MECPITCFDADAARILYGVASSGRIDALQVRGSGARYLALTAEVELYEAPDFTLAPAVLQLPGLQALQGLGTLDTRRIEMLNDTEAVAFTQVTLPDMRGYVRIQGWPCCRAARPGAVTVEFHGRPDPAEYGWPRPDTGELFHA